MLSQAEAGASDLKLRNPGNAKSHGELESAFGEHPDSRLFSSVTVKQKCLLSDYIQFCFVFFFGGGGVIAAPAN